MKSAAATVEWFMAQTRADGECRIWTRSIIPAGYGHFRLDKKTVYCHRWIYEQLIGPIPKGLCVMHSCDVRACVRIEHLSVGTHGDNARDAFAKGRRRLPVPHRKPNRGSTNLVPLELKDIAERRRAGERAVDIAREFGISTSTVYRVGAREGQ